MKITNRYNLPPAIYQALAQGTRNPEPYEYHVTEIIGPPLIRALKRKHWDDLEEDASERLWALLGTSVHHALEKAGDILNALKEETISTRVGNSVLHGTLDILHGTALEDYKVTSVFSYLFGLKPEWEKQLNVYAFKAQALGFPVESLRINAILRDWKRYEARRDPNYPEIPFVAFDVPLWPIPDQRRYVEERVSLFEQVDDGFIDPAPCTDEERWARSPSFAIVKDGLKKAYRVHDSMDAAEEMLSGMKDKDKYRIDMRPGMNIRCMDYCPVRSVCPYTSHQNAALEAA